jgi:hypothetical protein
MAGNTLNACAPLYCDSFHDLSPCINVIAYTYSEQKRIITNYSVSYTTLEIINSLEARQSHLTSMNLDYYYKVEIDNGYKCDVYIFDGNTLVYTTTYDL